MTIRNYIYTRLRPFGITEAHLVDVSLDTGIDVNEEIGPLSKHAVGTALVKVIEELMLSPRQNSVSEGGFSMSWDFGNLGAYYRWLCRKYGLTPDDDTLEALGVSRISDKTSKW